MGWTIFMSVVIVAFAIGFFILGYVLGFDVALESIRKTRFDTIDAERRMHDMTRAAFISMSEAADARVPRDTRSPRRGQVE